MAEELEWLKSDIPFTRLPCVSEWQSISGQVSDGGHRTKSPTLCISAILLFGTHFATLLSYN